jgi:hypothetical protein
VLYCEYRDGAMNCIDLVKIEGVSGLQAAAADVTPIAHAIELASLSVQPGWKATTVAHNGSILVTTPEESWAYAAAVPVAVDRIPAGHVRGVIRVRATVRTGRVGFAIPAADGAALVTEEYLACARSERAQECFVEFDVAARPAAMMIVRNASQSTGRSQVVVHSLELFSG